MFSDMYNKIRTPFESDEMKSYIFKAICLTALLLSFLLLPLSPYVSAVSFSGTDKENGSLYSVEQKEFNVTVLYGSKELHLTADDRILNTVCSDNTVTMLCTTKDFFYSVYRFNTSDNKLDYYVTSLKASTDAPVFDCDKSGTVCILNKDDSKVLDIVTTDTKASVKVPSVIYQILYTYNNELLVFAADGVYSIVNNSANRISDTVLSTPCSYANGLIIDASGNIYTYSHNSFEPYEITTTAKPLQIPDNITYKSDIIYLEPGTTFAKLYKTLGIDKSQLRITKPDGTSVASGKLGTGMNAKFCGKEYTIVIIGDLTGEGNINSRDLKVLMNDLSGEALLQGTFMEAADVFNDSKINTKDLLKLCNMY